MVEGMMEESCSISDSKEAETGQEYTHPGLHCFAMASYNYSCMFCASLSRREGPCYLFFFLVFLRLRSHCAVQADLVAEAGFELTVILLPQPPECWGYKHACHHTQLFTVNSKVMLKGEKKVMFITLGTIGTQVLIQIKIQADLIAWDPIIGS